jgi:hypothetical protein
MVRVNEDRITRAIIDRLAALKQVADAIARVTVLDLSGRVTFKVLGDAIAPRLGRAPSPALYHDIRRAAEMRGLPCGTILGAKAVVRGVRLAKPG